MNLEPNCHPRVVGQIEQRRQVADRIRRHLADDDLRNRHLQRPGSLRFAFLGGGPFDRWCGRSGIAAGGLVGRAGIVRRRGGFRRHGQARFAIAADDQQGHFAPRGGLRITRFIDGRELLAHAGLHAAKGAGGELERVAIVARVAPGHCQKGAVGEFGGHGSRRQFGLGRGRFSIRGLRGRRDGRRRSGHLRLLAQRRISEIAADGDRDHADSRSDQRQSHRGGPAQQAGNQPGQAGGQAE